MTMIRSLFLILATTAVLVVTAQPCHLLESELACFYNTSCTWATAAEIELAHSPPCVLLSTDCAERTLRDRCHRDDRCFWTDNSTCVDRYVPEALQQLDTDCHELFQLHAMVQTGKACQDNTSCEYDMYTNQCIADRALVCDLVETQEACHRTAGCWWQSGGSGGRCRAQLRSYFGPECFELDGDELACVKTGGYGFSCAYNSTTMRCEPKAEADTFMHLALTRYCNLDFSHPFDPFCRSSDTARCKLECTRDKPVCRVTESSVSLHVCQPQAHFTCQYVHRQEDCAIFSYCSWNSTNGVCFDPLSIPVPAAETSVTDDSATTSLITVVMVIGGMLVVFLIVFGIADIRITSKPAAAATTVPPSAREVTPRARPPHRRFFPITAFKSS